MSRNGEPVYSCFFQQSSFASFAVVPAKDFVTIRRDAPTVDLWVWPATEAIGSAAVPVIPQKQIALWDAVIAGNVTEANVAIKTGADVNGMDFRTNPNGRRPLNYAAWRNDTAMIRALLDAGANINEANRTGFTPVHHAGEAGSKEAATLLITNRANLTLRNKYGQTAARG